MSAALSGAKPPSSHCWSGSPPKGNAPKRTVRDLGPPEAHLAPGQHVAHEGRGHHQQEDDHAQQPHHFARGLVRSVEEAAEDVDVDHDEEGRSAVGVRIAHHPAPVHVADGLLDGVERHLRIGREVHGHDDAGDDLQAEAERGEETEVPEIVEVARNRITAADSVVDEARQGQPLIHPLHEGMAWGIFLGPGKAHVLDPLSLGLNRSLRPCRW